MRDEEKISDMRIKASSFRTDESKGRTGHRRRIHRYLRGSHHDLLVQIRIATIHRLSNTIASVSIVLFTNNKSAHLP
jgi:hypothetical protein